MTFLEELRPHAERLTESQMHVLRGMADGMSNAEIGRALYVSEDTVKTHARRLFKKLGARDRANAVALGFIAGHLTADGPRPPLPKPPPVTTGQRLTEAFNLLAQARDDEAAKGNAAAARALRKLAVGVEQIAAAVAMGSRT